jgi:hypothetical protein
MKLAVETGCSLASVVKWDRGGKLIPATEKSLTDAAKKLGLTDKRLGGPR